ncbi:MAG: hypothetical protein C4526_01400 [Nitrospiraceae bacterium]|nr:MAG: hypothetical protein C4526_01400 [Nitrospiraceae bacterium]
MDKEASMLNSLIKKYKSEIEEYEREYANKVNALKEKMHIAYEAVKLLEQEKMVQSDLPLDESTFNRITPESLNEKYKNMSLSQAVLDVLSNSDSYLDAGQVYEELIKSGYTSSSSDIKRDVFIALYRLDKREIITSKKTENRKKYLMPLTKRVIKTIEEAK